MRWQICPRMLNVLMASKDKKKARRVGEAMLKMVKLEIETLQAAADGD